MPRKNLLPPLHPIHPRTLAEVGPGSRVVVRDAWGKYNDRIAMTGVVRGRDFLVVWVARAEEYEAAQRESRDCEQVPWPAEDVWIPGEEPPSAPVPPEGEDEGS